MDASEDTTAEEILMRCSNDMLKPMFTITNNKGRRGAPSHPVASQIPKPNQTLDSFRRISSKWHVIRAETESLILTVSQFYN